MNNSFIPLAHNLLWQHSESTCQDLKNQIRLYIDRLILALPIFSVLHKLCEERTSAPFA